jgi:hypothetical protein
MPKELERRLRREIEKDPKKRKWSKERKERYIYGAMRKMGWKPKGEK